MDKSDWPGWPEWLDLFVRSAPSKALAEAAAAVPDRWRHYWEQGYSPDHAWQEEAQTDPDGVYLLGRSGEG